MRDLADRLDLQAEYRVVDGLIGAAQGTKAVPKGASVAVHALHAGRGFDQARVERFDEIAGQLAVMAMPDFTARASIELPFGFFEAYFSNFIEGTEFAVDEALEVVFEGAEPGDRPSGDAHDVRGTFELVTDTVDRSRVPTDPDELCDLLLTRHRVLLGGRPEHSPGEFKHKNNQAGGYVFVARELVVGTLEQAHSRALSLTPGIARAIYWLFTIAEIHPFSDGNGRIARVFANAELSAVGLTRIIIPTVFRYEYLNALRLASNHGDIDALVKVCVFAQQWAAGLDFSSVDTARADLEATNAFIDPTADVSARLLLK